jgi:hypothetical protein
MHGTVMATAQFRQLRQRRAPTERPRLQMVRVTAPGRATRKLTMPVSRLERAPDGGWHRTGPAPDIQHRPITAMPHDDDRGVTQKPLRCFRGNVRRAVANFDDGVTAVWHTSRFLR